MIFLCLKVNKFLVQSRSGDKIRQAFSKIFEKSIFKIFFGKRKIRLLENWVWVLGNWVFGHLGIWASGNLGIWEWGHLGIWANGSRHLGNWAIEQLGNWAIGSGYLGIWVSGRMVLGIWGTV